MRVIINPNAREGAQWAARFIVNEIKKKAANSHKPFVLGLPTGSTPLDTYQELVRMHKAGEISFKNVITFNMDEYVGIPKKHPQSYYTFMHENFFDHIDICPENIHILNGNAPDFEMECDNYEKMISEAGGIDLFMGGVGEDGHLAFNEPFSSLSSLTRIKTLTTDTRAVNSRFFDNDLNQVPKLALTVGIATVTNARKVLILAFGAKKAEAIHQAIEGAISSRWPVTAIQNHRHGIIVCDEAAASHLAPDTVEYFKDIEKC